MKKPAALLVFLLAATLARAQNAAVGITVDPSSNRHPIDPRIYGLNYATPTQLQDLRVPLHRLGGNNTSRYNWNINADNRGSDYFFESVPYASATAGAEVDAFIASTHTGGAEPMVTIPLIDWVAKLGANRSVLGSFPRSVFPNQCSFDGNSGDGLQADCSTKITGNDKNLANVPAGGAFQQGFINHLVSAWGGAAAPGGLKYYLLDNEHSIWFITHRDVHPDGPTMEEIRNKIIDVGTRIRNADPAAKIVGPEEWGWGGLFYSGSDWARPGVGCPPDCPDRAAHGDMDYLPWLLNQLRQHDIPTGKRVIDVFSVHYYPQQANLVYAGSAETLPATQLARNRSTRSLWDPSYVDESWVQFGPPPSNIVRLVPRIKEWVDTYYPGLETGITEYNWGAEDHINGATTQADILGIFGREGLDLATRWTTPASDTPTYKSFKMYRNYDGNGNGFGDTSVSATGPNPDNVAVFAAERSSDDALTIMVINKVLSGTTPATINLGGGFTPSGAVQVWQLRSTNVITRLADATVAAGKVQMTLPAQSITLLVLPHKPTLSVADALAPEPASGTGTAAVPVTLSVPSNSTVTVAFATANGTATAGTDYTATSGTVTFGPGETSRTILVPIMNDGVSPEANKAFTVSLSAPTEASLGDAQATVTIVDTSAVQKLDWGAASYTTTEGGTAVLTVRRSNGSTNTLKVSYSTVDGTATAPGDYTSASGTLTFGPGVLSQTVKIATGKDTVDEGTETLLLRLTSVTGPAALGPRRTALVNILDNDKAGVIQFGAPTYSVSEGAGTATVKLTRTGGLAGPLTVTCSVIGGGSAQASDYTFTSASVPFAAGQTTASLSFPILQDGTPEGDETVNLGLSAPTGRATLGARSTTVLTIRDDEKAVFFAAPTFSVKESAPKAVITVRRSGDLSAPATVNYASVGGTATSDDYTQVSGTLAFAAKVATRTFTVPIKADRIVEGNETVNLTLSGPVGVDLTPSSSAVLTILEDDLGGVIQFGAANYSAKEGMASLQILVKRSGGSAGGVTVAYSVTGGTATNGADFTLPPATLDFAAGVMSRTLVVPVANDTGVEGPETFTVTLANPTGGASLGPVASTTVTLLDNEPGVPTVQLGAAAYRALEPPGSTSSGFVTLTVRRAGNLTGPSSVTLSTANGTATAGQDYTAQVAVPVAFAAGQAAATVKIPILGDLVDEPDEQFTVSISGTGVIAPSSAIVTIADNDVAGTIQFQAAEWSVSEWKGFVEVTVTRTKGTAAGASVHYATVPGSATAIDYSPTSGTLTFAAGEMSKTIMVSVTGDGTSEGAESFGVVLSSPSFGVVLGAPSTTTVWIVDEN